MTTQEAPRADTADTDQRDAPLQRADGLVMIGEMAGSGYRTPPCLVRRADGQTVQLTPLLYAVLEAIDGHRDTVELAASVAEATGRPVNAQNIADIADKLRPLGLLVRADGTQPPVQKRNPLLGLRLRYSVTEPERTRRLTDPFRVLFRPWLVIPLLAAFAVVCWWVFLRKGLASAAWDAFERPGLLILVFVVTVVSAGFHEFGHAAAARYGGATPGAMGFGVYLVWPAFYTDVTDSYRLGRAGRVRTDLGGLYFNAIVAVAITGLWWWLRYDALLLVVATQILQMLRQLAPMVRFDGYHVLADLTGVPDLYSRIKPVLLSLLPWRWRDPQARMLKPWARAVVTAWVFLVVPLLLATLAAAILGLPRLVGTAWSALHKQSAVLTDAWGDGDVIQIVARVLAIVAIIIPVAGVLYMLVRLVRRTSVGAWHGTAGKPMLRLLACAAGATVAAAVAVAWMPHEGNYRPIQAGERGTLSDIVYALRSDPLGMAAPQTVHQAVRPTATRLLNTGQRGIINALWDGGSARPTQAAPTLALIMVPRTGGGGGGAGGGAVATAPPADQGWVFPVNKPLAPDPGDNQALAVNTTDGTAEYEAAFAMVWVTDGSDALNVNEAQAYASCQSCSSVAVAYQVVFVVDSDETDDNVVAPQNLAGSLNYDCTNCLTYSLAKQLFITLDEPLSPDATARLNTVWAKMQAYSAAIESGSVPIDEIEPQLDAFTAEIEDIVESDQPGTIPTTSNAATTSTVTTPTTSAAPATTSAAPTTSASPPMTTEAAADTTQSTTSGPSASAATPAQSSTESTAGTTAPTGTTSDGTASDGTASDSTDGSASDSSSSDGGTTP